MSSVDRLARELADLRDQVAASGSPQLAHSAIVDGAVEQVETFDTGEVDELGNPVYGTRLVARFGQQPDGSNTVNTILGPTPPRPIGHVVTAGPGFVAVEWFGAFEERIEPYLDHDYVAVHLGTTANFTPIADTQKATIRSTAGEKVTIAMDPGTYYVKLVAVSTVPNYSAPSGSEQGAPGTASSVDVTARQMAEDAQAAADAADTKATNAQSIATNAMTVASGKNKITYSPNLPAGTPIFAMDGTLTGIEIPAGTTPLPTDGDLWYDLGADASVDHVLVFNLSLLRWENKTAGTSAITRGAITADLLASQLVLASKIIAGPPNDVHVELDQQGFIAYGRDLDGNLGATTRIGSGEADAIAVYDPSTSEILAGLDSEGKLTASMADVGRSYGDTWINGLPFESYFDMQPRGVVDYGIRTTALTGAGAGVENAFLEVQTILEPGRLYRISSNSIYVQSTATSVTTEILGVMRMTLAPDDGFSPAPPVGTSSGQYASARVFTPPISNLGPMLPPMEFWLDTTDWTNFREARILISVLGKTSGYTYSMVASASLPAVLSVEDKGVGMSEVGIDRSANTGGTTTSKVYTSTWIGTVTASYTGSGTKRTDTTDMVQGHASPNGNQYAITAFSGGAASSTYSSELGKGIGLALSGATLTKVEFYLYFNHWYYSAGGTCYWGVSASNAPFGSTANAFNPQSYSTNWPKPGGRWITVPSSLWPANNSIRSVYIGQPPTTSSAYYGRANGAGASSNKPLLRLTYKRVN